MGLLSSIFGDGGAGEAKKQRRKAEREARERKAAIESGTARVRGAFDATYTDQFYEGLRRALESYYMPQVEDQYQDASKKALYGLTRNGLRQSSARASVDGRLQTRYNQAKQDVVRKGENLVGQRKNEVGRALEGAIMQINAAEDPIAAANISANNADLSTYSPEYAPLGQVFVDLTNGLAVQSQLSDRGQNRYGTPSWLNWASSSGRTRG